MIDKSTPYENTMCFTVRFSPCFSCDFSKHPVGTECGISVATCNFHTKLCPLGGDAVKRCHVKGEMNWNNACLQIAASCDTESTCLLTDPLQIKSESTGIDKHSLFFSVVKNMSDTRDYQRLLDQEEVEQVSWETFHVWLTGRTNEAHYPIIEMLKRIGQTQVNSPEECDYLLVFCPIVSRVGTDIEEALSNLPCSKPVILVVMHHTFNPHSVVSESKRQVNNPNVHLTVDCLFYEDKLLNCKLNDNIEDTLLKLFKLSVYQMILWYLRSLWTCCCITIK